MSSGWCYAVLGAGHRDGFDARGTRHPEDLESGYREPNQSTVLQTYPGARMGVHPLHGSPRRRLWRLVSRNAP
jgi:hypothetical protein